MLADRSRLQDREVEDLSRMQLDLKMKIINYSSPVLPTLAIVISCDILEYVQCTYNVCTGIFL